MNEVIATSYVYNIKHKDTTVHHGTVPYSTVQFTIVQITAAKILTVMERIYDAILKSKYTFCPFIRSKISSHSGLLFPRSEIG